MSIRKFEQEQLEETIEGLDDNITEMSTGDFEDVVAGNSREAFTLRRRRKKIRYRLRRIQTAINGGPAAEDTEGLKEQFEAMKYFGGWRDYGRTWDVDLVDPMLIVHRDFTVEEEWEMLVRNKFPQIQPGGKITYPDIKVKRKVDRQALADKLNARSGDSLSSDSGVKLDGLVNDN